MRVCDLKERMYVAVAVAVRLNTHDNPANTIMLWYSNNVTVTQIQGCAAYIIPMFLMIIMMLKCRVT